MNDSYGVYENLNCFLYSLNYLLLTCFKMAVNLPESNDFEGYLEKHGTGTVSKFLGKQKKTWCFLQGAWLYCHQSNNKRSSVVSSIDLTEAQMIRRITTDRSGLQFEIVTKFKNITFTAGTSNECNEWIKRLQKAMTLKDNSTAQISDRISSNLNHYDEIDMNPVNKTPIVKQQSSSVSQYEDIDKFHTSTKKTPNNGSHYASIDDDDDVFSAENNKKPSTVECASEKCEYSSVIPKELRKFPSTNDYSPEQKSTEECGIVGSPNKKTSSIEMPSEEEDSARNISHERNPVHKDKDHAEMNSSKGDNEMNLDSEEESIDDVHSMIPKTFPELKEELYLLKEEDKKPISDLKNFLHNKNLDDRSYTPIVKSEMTDPFEILKSYLNSLDL